MSKNNDYRDGGGKKNKKTKRTRGAIRKELGLFHRARRTNTKAAAKTVPATAHRDAVLFVSFSSVVICVRDRLCSQ